jgi:hypothetical protein
MTQCFDEPRKTGARRRLLRAAGLLCFVFATGCATKAARVPSPYPELARARARRAATQSEAKSTAKSDEKAAYALTDRYLVYSVAWGRADELAAALEPVLQARYGPEARVVAHSPSNQLFIHIPSGRPDPTAARAASTPRAAPTPQAAPTPRNTPTRRTTPPGGRNQRS